MIAALVERGKLSWDVTIGEVLGDLPMREVYAPVTLEQLLQHRGGLQTMPTGGEFAAPPEALPARPPREGRLALTKQVLQERPVAKPGSEMNYCNAGYVVAGVMVERLLDTPFEQLMTSLVLQPFGLDSCRFGWPATPDAPHQPWGHIGAPPGLRPHVPGTFWNFDFTTYLAPAGHISCNVSDLAKYAAAHLRGLRGANGALTSASIRRLHTPPEIDAEGKGYASGWFIAPTEDGTPEHWHSGSPGSFFAVVSIYPEDDLVIAVVTNYGLAAEKPVYPMMEAIRARSVAPQRGAP
jgi:CubicO group peptidase (beta-lactamase class C family)